MIRLKSFFLHCFGYIVVLLCFGCNHVFYHPDKEVYLTPDRVKFKNERMTITQGEVSLAAWYFQTKQPKSKGLVIQAHGNAENMTSHAMNLRFFLHDGFDALAFDYQGYGDSSGKPTRENSVSDMIMVIKFAKQRFPDHRLILFGQSLGGAIATTALGRDLEAQSFVSGVILDSTFASYRGIARQKLGEIWLTWPLQYPLSFLVSSDLDPDEYAASIKIPALQIHATDDPIVPVEQGRKLFAALPVTTKKEWVEFKERSHTAGFVASIPEVMSAFDRFLLNVYSKQ